MRGNSDVFKCENNTLSSNVTKIVTIAMPTREIMSFAAKIFNSNGVVLYESIQGSSFNIIAVGGRGIPGPQY